LVAKGALTWYRFFDRNARNAGTSEEAERLAGAEIRRQYPRMSIHWCAIPLALSPRARFRAGGLAEVCRSATQPKTRYQKDAQEYRGAGALQTGVLLAQGTGMTVHGPACAAWRAVRDAGAIQGAFLAA